MSAEVRLAATGPGMAEISDNPTSSVSRSGSSAEIETETETETEAALNTGGKSEAPEWVECLTDFLNREAEAEGEVEAILVRPGSHQVSLATLGDVDEAKLRSRLDAVLRSLDEARR